MKELAKEIDLPKPYLMELLGDYMEVENNIDRIIAATGYKHEFIARKLKMPISTYYSKRRKKTFTTKDVFKIVKMLDEDEAYNAAEIELMDKRKDEETISGEAFLQQLEAMMQQ